MGISDVFSFQWVKLKFEVLTTNFSDILKLLTLEAFKLEF